MANRQIQTPSVLRRDLRKAPESVRREAWRIARTLSENIFDERLNIRKLHGYRNVWRVSFLRDYRLIYTFDDEAVFILRVAHRKDIYRKGLDFDEL